MVGLFGEPVAQVVANEFLCVLEEGILPPGVGVATLEVAREDREGVEITGSGGGEASVALVGDLGLDGGDMVGGREGVMDFADSELGGLLCGKGDAEADDGVVNGVVLDGVEDLASGIEVSRGNVNVDGGEGSGVYFMEAEIFFRDAFAGRCMGVNVDDAEALEVVFFSEVDALEATSVDH
jgi:hypothetical protein